MKVIPFFLIPPALLVLVFVVLPEKIGKPVFWFLVWAFAVTALIIFNHVARKRHEVTPTDPPHKH